MKNLCNQVCILVHAILSKWYALLYHANYHWTSKTQLNYILWNTSHSTIQGVDRFVYITLILCCSDRQKCFFETLGRTLGLARAVADGYYYLLCSFVNVRIQPCFLILLLWGPWGLLFSGDESKHRLQGVLRFGRSGWGFRKIGDLNCCFGKAIKRSWKIILWWKKFLLQTSLFKTT